MYCTYCGKEIEYSAHFCQSCGASINLNNNLIKTEEPLLNLYKINTFLLIILNILSIWIFQPVWYLIQLNKINKLNSIKKINLGFVIIWTLSYIIQLFLLVIPSLIHNYNNDYMNYYTYDITVGEGIGTLLGYLNAIASIVLAFRLRRILLDHIYFITGKIYEISGVLTFFFSNVYINYKINEVNNYNKYGYFDTARQFN